MTVQKHSFQRGRHSNPRSRSKVQLSPVWTTTNLAPMCSGCGCYFAASFTQTEKERGVMKDQVQNSRLKNITKERLRLRH